MNSRAARFENGIAISPADLILRLLSAAPEGLRISDICKETPWPARDTKKLVASLVLRGVHVRVEHGQKASRYFAVADPQNTVAPGPEQVNEGDTRNTEVTTDTADESGPTGYPMRTISISTESAEASPTAEVAGPNVPIFQRYARSWPVVLETQNDRRLRDDDFNEAGLPLAEALSFECPGDQHFVAYANRFVDVHEKDALPGVDLERRPVRLKTLALADAFRMQLQPSQNVEMQLLVVDVDDPIAHEQDIPARAEWRAEEAPKLTLLEAKAPGFLRYNTNGGYRLIWVLDEPAVLDSLACADYWKDFYVRSIGWIKRETGIEGDETCKDWTRIYRLPNVVREKIGTQTAAVHGALTASWPTTDESRCIASVAKQPGAGKRQQSGNGAAPDGGDPAIVTPLTSELAAALETAWTAGERQSWFLQFLGWLCGKGWSEDERDALLDELEVISDDKIGKYRDMSRRARVMKGPSAEVKEALGDAFDAIDKIVNGHPHSKSKAVRALEKSVRARNAAPENAANDNQGEETEPLRARVRVDSCAQHNTNDEAIAALAQAGELYQRNQKLVSVIEDDSGEYSGAVIRELPAAVLQDRLTRCASFFRLARVVSESEGEATENAAPVEPEVTWREVGCAPPEWCVKYVYAAGKWPGVRALSGIIETPSLRPDGSIIQEPGHDAATGYYFAPSCAFLTVDDAPSHTDAKQALELLREVFQDFPFKQGADRDVPIAAILTLVSRPAIQGAVPAFLLDASMSRSGKGAATNVISLIALGRTFAPINYPTSKEEQEKILGGYALRGVPLIPFDNIEGCVFGGGSIERAVTAEDRIALRVLGKSDTPEVQWRAVILGTGNNVQCTRDMSARVIRARLEPKQERPEDRKPEEFKHYPLLPWVKEERARLVAAALTIVRAYFVAGCPPVEGKAVADFAAWARVVRDSLIWAGGEDVALTRVEAAQTDDHGLAFATILGRMYELDPKGAGKSAGAWIDALRVGPDADANAAAREALQTLCYPKEVDATQLGTAFRSAVGRVVGDVQLARGDKAKRGVAWLAQKV